jgi:hypothetical protein
MWLLRGFSLCVGLIAAAVVQAAPVSDFLAQHCVECHSGDTKAAGLDLTTLELQLDKPHNFATWEKIHDLVASGEMPPQKSARPPQASRAAFLSVLDEQLTRADVARQDRDGRTGIRRLSRVEFENTLRDLLVVPHLRVLSDLPADGKSFGFDRSPAALDFSFVHLAKHLAAVDAALDAATPAFAEQPQSFTYRWYPWNVTVIGTLTEHKEAIGLIGLKRDETFFAKASRITDEEPKATAIGLFRIGDDSARYRVSPFTPVIDGLHRIRVSGYSFGWDGKQVVPTEQHGAVSFGILSEGRNLGLVNLPPNKAEVVELTAWLRRGGAMTPGVPDELRFTPETCQNLGHYAGSRNGIRQDVIGPPHQAPGVAIEWIEIEGPIHESWPPPSQLALFGDLPVQVWTAQSGVPQPVQQVWPRGRHTASQPRDIYGSRNEKRPVVHVVSNDPLRDGPRLIASFLRRAFRRPVNKAETQFYVDIFTDRFKAGLHFQDALKDAYRAALTSPDFMLLNPASPHATASRLSYLLGASPPDDALLVASERGELADSSKLRAQAERLLADPKVARFIDNFTGQWLRLRDIDATQPDKQLYPEFTTLLQESMVAETRAYFHELLRRDLGAVHIVKSNFAMLNQPLAKHYGIANVIGHQLRRVELPKDSLRGPFLSQASMLKVTANGTTTSPVRRGAFVLETLLGITPAPPPPGAGSIEPDTRGATTIRELLDKHKTLATCAGCHAKMDPYGLALESFDVTGEWRDHYRATGAKGREEDRKIVNGRGIYYHFEKPVDPSGQLHDGRSFEGFVELRDLLAADERGLARALVGHLVTYATGAPVTFADRREVERILDRAEPSRYGVRTLLLELVLSPLFAKP